MTTSKPVKNGCTVGLLAIAAEASYRNQSDKIEEEIYQDSLISIEGHGYKIDQSEHPEAFKGAGKTPLSVLCLLPQDENLPIVVSFRGTKIAGDVLANLQVAITGVMGREYRDAAFAFYEKVRRKYPNREIVLTGHSLGGHIAQYVGTKAYNTDEALFKNPLVHVRTFNTAPVDTTHSSVFARPDRPKFLLSRFVNYRLHKDPISDLAGQFYYGSTFDFLTHVKRSRYDAHKMTSIAKDLPDDVQNQTVGSDRNGSELHNRLIESINGLHNCYQCRVEGQFFSKSRAGYKNLDKMNKNLPEVIKLLDSHQYNDAIRMLINLKESFSGKVSKDFIEMLITNAIYVKENYLIVKNNTNSSREPVAASTSNLTNNHQWFNLVKRELSAENKNSDAPTAEFKLR